MERDASAEVQWCRVDVWAMRRALSDKLSDEQLMRAVMRLPLTTHVLPSKRVVRDSSQTPCSRAGCGRLVGRGCLHCPECGYEAYCSAQCQGEHQRSARHDAQCKASATARLRRMPSTLVKAIDAYFAPASQQLARGLPPGQYVRPMRISELPPSQKTNTLCNLELWLSLHLLSHAYRELPCARDGNALLCMSCRKPTRLTRAAARSVVTTEERARELEAHPPAPEDAEPLGEVGNFVRLTFTGVSVTGDIYGRMSICCGDACHASHDPMQHHFALLQIEQNPLNGLVTIHCVQNPPPPT